MLLAPLWDAQRLSHYVGSKDSDSIGAARELCASPGNHICIPE